MPISKPSQQAYRPVRGRRRLPRKTKRLGPGERIRAANNGRLGRRALLTLPVPRGRLRRQLIAVVAAAVLLAESGSPASATGYVPAAAVEPGAAAASHRNTVPLAISAPPVSIATDAVGTVVAPQATAVRVEPSAHTRVKTAKEVIGLRTENRDVVENPDGTYTATYSSGRVNYQDPNGAWQPIDTTFVADPTDGYAWRTKANDIVVRAATADAAAHLAELSLGGHTIRLRAPSATAATLDPAANAISLTGAGGPAVVFTPTPEGLDWSATYASVADAAPLTIILDPGDLSVALGADGRTVELRDATGVLVGMVSEPWLTEATGDGGPPEATTVMLEPLTLEVPTATALSSPGPVSPGPTGAVEASPGPASPGPTTATEVRLTYTVDPTWLAAPGRAWPVVLDPAVTMQANGTGTDNCNSTATNYADTWLTKGLPSQAWCWSAMRIGYDNNSSDGQLFDVMRGLFWFKGVALGTGDGEEVTSATFSLNQYAGSTTAIETTLVTGEWSVPEKWQNQLGGGGTDAIDYLCSNGSSSGCGAQSAYYTTPVNAPGTSWLDQDVTALVRHWYSRNGNDWKANLGFMSRTATEDSSHKEATFRNGIWSSTAVRPKLVVSYIRPQVKLAFDASLGADFAPATMPAGLTVSLPVNLTNNGSGYTFGTTGSDYYRVGARWFDEKGKLVSQTGLTNPQFANLPGVLASGDSTGTFSLPVTAPPNPGQYSLRIDLVHTIGATNLFASDWAMPSKYYARAKDPLNSSTGNVRWVGTSVIERDDFGIAVVAGGGSAVGETKAITLADGSRVGINLWSHSLLFAGAGGVGFADLGTSLGLGYGYNSADRLDCTGILAACGWWTSFDEGFTKATNGADYAYRDAAGNRYLVNANGGGQLASGAPAQLDRPRFTLWNENTLTGWTGTAPTYTTAEAYNGTHSLYITAANTGTSTTLATPIDLDTHKLVSFAVKGVTTTGAAIAFKLKNDTTGTTGWIAYTIGSDFTISGVTKVPLGGSIFSWNETVQHNLYQDAQGASFGSTYDHFTVTDVKLIGKTGSGTAYFDTVRFEGHTSGIFDDTLPAWTSGTGASLNTIDKVSGSASIEVSYQSPANSPKCDPCWSSGLYVNPYVQWSWRKVGGSSIAIAYYLTDIRTGATDSITYYAGPTAPSGFAHPVQIATAAPVEWTTLHRDLLDDARQILGWYWDTNYDSIPTAPPVSGQGIPDDIKLTGIKLSAVDGTLARFDHAFLASIPEVGPDFGATVGDDFTATFRGGAEHRYDREGHLHQALDLDGNATTLDWTYDGTGLAETLTTIHAPSDGQPVSGGTAQREIAVTYPTSAVRFTEALGTTTSATGRYTEFDRNGSADLVTVVPARWDAACGTGTNPQGCLTFSYTGTHQLNLISDPRKTSANAFTTTIAWTGTDPTTITADATSSALLRVLAWNTGTSWRVRPEFQDADGVATGANGYARYDDLSPNGSVLAEYAPVACTAANCVSAPAPSDMLASYATDGTDHYTTETRYRLTGNLGAVTTRQGTLAAAKVDNYVDTITGGLTAWTQTAEQYAASVAAGNADLYRTTYGYDDRGLQTHAATPYTNPVGTGNVAVQDIVSVYDAEGHPTEISDKGFIANPGFESALTGWTTSGVTADGTLPNAGLLSAKLTGAASLVPATLPELLPGQGFRFQFAIKPASGSTITYKLEYQKADASWATLLGPTGDATASWHTLAFDSVVPLDGNGVVRPTFTTASGSANVDDVVVFTAYGASAYNANGTPDSRTDALGQLTKVGYAASASLPAIFPTSSTADWVSPGTGGAADENAITTTTYDVWGRPLVVTDPDGVAVTTTYAANQTDVASVAPALGDPTTYPAYDAIGERLTVVAPLSRQTTTTYSFFGDPVDVTAPDATVTHATSDGVGRLTALTRNYVSGGSGTSGTNNTKETRAYDAYGRVTTDVVDAGVTDSTTSTTYDLAGDVTSVTVYPDGTSNPRTTTTYFDAAGTPAGSAGPIVPTDAGVQACPGAAGTHCNSVSTIDLAGRTSAVTDAYGKVAATWSDFAGRPVAQIANYVAAGGATSDQNVTVSTRYDAAGHVVAVTDPLGRVTSTVYDKLDRVTKVIRPDSSWLRTDYTKAGRTDAVSRPGSTGQVDTDVAWTKNLYDAAGRLVTSLANFDRTGAPELTMAGFETGTLEGVASGPADAFIGGGATATVVTSPATIPNTGRDAVGVATTTGASNEGTKLALAGTFLAGHTYKAAIYVKAAGTGFTDALLLGVPGGSSVTGTVASSAAWQQLVTPGWTPASATTGVELAFRPASGTSSATTATIDDIAVWDVASPDANIPTTTIYDAASEVVASIAPPGHAGEPGPVTASAYDAIGRLTSVTVADIAGLAPGPDVNLTTGFGYDALGRRTDATDPTGIVGHTDYDRRGNVTATTLDYLSGQPASATVNVRSTFAYDDRDELLASCTAQAVQAASCDPAVPSSSAWRQTYDAAGHVIDAIPPVNTTATPLVTTTAVFDSAFGGARQTRACDHPAGASACTAATRYTDFAFDNVGRVTSAVTYQGAPTGTEKLRTATTYDAAGQATGVDYTENGAGSPTDSLAFGFDLLGRQTTVSRSGSPITTTVYNADSTVATRTDHVLSATASAFGYDLRGNLTSATSPLFTGSATYGWRLDGLIDARTWPGTSNAAAFTYDAAKRPTKLVESVSGNPQVTFDRAYDRAGSVTSETQTIPTLSGYVAGTAQTFGYDALRRVTSSSMSTITRGYTYDADSNRLTATENGTPTTFAYDATDELLTQKVGSGGTVRSVTYDAYGNATSVPNPDGTATFTTYTYDLGDRLTGQTPATGSGAVTYTIDALGRHRTRTASGSTSTYTYAGAGPAVVRIATGAANTDSAIDAIGSRLATKTASSFGWLLPDLHGNVAAAVGSTGATVSDAFRYDPYGKVVASTTSALPTPWRYQGRLLESSGSDPALYDFIFRSYDPALGAFLSEDDVAGKAQDPLTFNRFLYAEANPETLVDPDGHASLYEGGDCGPNGIYCGGTSRSDPINVKQSTTVAAKARVVFRPRPKIRTYEGRQRDVISPWDLQADPAYGELGTVAGQACAVYGNEQACQVLDQLRVLYSKTYEEYCAIYAFECQRVEREGTHSTLGLASMIPVLGSVFGFADAVLYAGQGDWANAGLSLAGSLPIAGTVGKIARVGGELGHLGEAGRVGEVVGVRGGVYTLRDLEGNVVRTGRSKDLLRRLGEYLRDPATTEYEFVPEFWTDNYVEQRGLEHMLYSSYPDAALNRIGAISLRNPRLFDEYVDAAWAYLGRQ
jgi:RHS repeat-associated protein